MTWAKLDDHFHAHPKVVAAWRSCRASIGLHAMALSHCGAYLSDGEIPEWWVRDQLPKAAERTKVVEALVRAGLWEPREGGWVIHDYLVINESRASVMKRKGTKSDDEPSRAYAGGRARGRARAPGPTQTTPDLFPQLAS